MKGLKKGFAVSYLLVYLSFSAVTAEKFWDVQIKLCFFRTRCITGLRSPHYLPWMALSTPAIELLFLQMEWRNETKQLYRLGTMFLLRFFSHTERFCWTCVWFQHANPWISSCFRGKYAPFFMRIIFSCRKIRVYVGFSFLCPVKRK